MIPEMNRRTALGELLAVSALSAMVGCHSADGFFGKHKCGDEVPHGAIPQPVGTYACRWQQAQMIRAEQDDFVIYEKEWVGESAQLTSGGNAQVHKMARRLLDQPFTAVIEPHSDPTLNESRRVALVQFLLEREVPSAEERVVIGTPAAEGMFGQEAPIVTRGYFGGGNQAGGGGQGMQGGGLGGGTGGGGNLGGGGYF